MKSKNTGKGLESETVQYYTIQLPDVTLLSDEMS